MSALGFTLFDTPIGSCAIAWGGRGINGVQLPEGSEGAARARMRDRFPGVPEREAPAHARRAIAAIVALLNGEAADLTTISLDMDRLPPFHQRVYAMARRIPAGETRSYGEVATHIGAPGAARAVGQALRRNPFPIVVPCHRVLAAGGKVGGFTATGGTDTKLRLLAIEGASGLSATMR